VAAKRFLVVRLAGREFAIPAWCVCGMLQMRGLDVHPVEDLEPVRYLVNLHGRALPVVVPNAILGLKERAVSARSCVLLIRGGAAAQGGEVMDADAAHCALLVDSVSRLEEIPPVRRREPGHVKLGEKWREVLDVERLCGVYPAGRSLIT